jgi:hypothetical protein
MPLLEPSLIQAMGEFDDSQEIQYEQAISIFENSCRKKHANTAKRRPRFAWMMFL